jgi:hypothetical protein
MAGLNNAPGYPGGKVNVLRTEKALRRGVASLFMYSTEFDCGQQFYALFVENDLNEENY